MCSWPSWTMKSSSSKSFNFDQQIPTAPSHCRAGRCDAHDLPPAASGQGPIGSTKPKCQQHVFFHIWPFVLYSVKHDPVVHVGWKNKNHSEASQITGISLEIANDQAPGPEQFGKDNGLRRLLHRWCLSWLSYRVSMNQYQHKSHCWV